MFISINGYLHILGYLFVLHSIYPTRKTLQLKAPLFAKQNTCPLVYTHAEREAYALNLFLYIRYLKYTVCKYVLHTLQIHVLHQLVQNAIHRDILIWCIITFQITNKQLMITKSYLPAEVCFPINTLEWRHNERDGVSNHQPHDCSLNRVFRHRSTKTSKLRVTGLCEGNSPVTDNSCVTGWSIHD